jgi:hypothetical protein
MSGERLASLAVDAAIDWIDAQLQTYLTAVETARSMTAGTLAPPVDVIGVDLPKYGGAGPLVEVFANGMKSINIENRHWSVDLTAMFTKACDADIEAGRNLIYDYATALVDCFAAGRTLGSKVGSALITDVSFASARGSNAPTLQHAAIDLEVRLFDA